MRIYKIFSWSWESRSMFYLLCLRKILNEMAHVNSEHISCVEIGTQPSKPKHVCRIPPAEFCNQGEAHKIPLCPHPAHRARFPGPSSGDLTQQAQVAPENLDVTSAPRRFLHSGKFGEHQIGTVIPGNTSLSLRQFYV